MTTVRQAGPRLRLGVVGLGRVFERHHRAALHAGRDWMLAAASDPDRSRRGWAAVALPGVPRFATLGEMLARVPLDAALVATPPSTHGPLVIEALGAGLHVLVEKPMALTSEEASLMTDAAHRARRALCVGFVRRFRRPYRDLRARLRGAARDGLVELASELAVDARRWGAVTQYLRDEASGGDVWDDVLSHQVDLVAWLTGEAITAVRADSWEPAGARATVACQVRLTSGLVARCRAVQGDRYAERVEARLGARTLVALPTALFETHAAWAGTVARIAGLRTFGPLALRRLTGAPTVTAESFAGQLDAFAAAARGESPTLPAADAASGARALAAVAAGRESVRLGGCWVPLAPPAGAPRPL